MKQIIYGLVSDGGDGSSSVHWFRNKDLVDKLLETESFYANEGDSIGLVFPEDLNLEECGFNFSDDNDWSWDLKEWE